MVLNFKFSFSSKPFIWLATGALMSWEILANESGWRDEGSGVSNEDENSSGFVVKDESSGSESELFWRSCAISLSESFSCFLVGQWSFLFQRVNFQNLWL